MSLNPNLPLVYHPNYSFSFDPKHRFVMSKFAQLYQHVKTLGLAGSNILEPPHGRVEELEIVHCKHHIY